MLFLPVNKYVHFFRIEVHPQIIFLPDAVPDPGCILQDSILNYKVAAALARTSHQLSTAAPQSGMSTALRSVGLLDIPSSMPAVPSVARLVSTPACDASLQNPVRSAG
jgi:hypothetical protein